MSKPTKVHGAIAERRNNIERAKIAVVKTMLSFQSKRHAPLTLLEWDIAFTEILHEINKTP